jgi:hypothetical protein
MCVEVPASRIALTSWLIAIKIHQELTLPQNEIKDESGW